MTSHSRVSSATFGEYVFTVFPKRSTDQPRWLAGDSPAYEIWALQGKSVPEKGPLEPLQRTRRPRGSFDQPFFFAARLPDSDSLAWIKPQRVTRLDAKGVVELVDVSHNLIAAELWRRVWIDGQSPLDLLGPRLVLPGLRPGEEEPLGTAQSIDDGRFHSLE